MHRLQSKWRNLRVDGLSGSGKSTLLRAVNGLNKVTRGNVMVDDGAEVTDVANCDPATLRKLRMNSIAMVFQQFALLPWRTVRENVGLGLEFRGVSAKKRRDTVSEKLEMVGLEQWQNKYVHELSGGMQQRVGLARAFATDANILLMDEPFSALDPLIRTRLQDELLDLQNPCTRPSCLSVTIWMKRSRSATALRSWRVVVSFSMAPRRKSFLRR